MIKMRIYVEIPKRLSDEWEAGVGTQNIIDGTKKYGKHLLVPNVLMV